MKLNSIKTEASSEIHYEKRSLRTVSGSILGFEKFYRFFENLKGFNSCKKRKTRKRFTIQLCHSAKLYPFAKFSPCFINSVTQDST